MIGILTALVNVRLLAANLKDHNSGCPKSGPYRSPLVFLRQRHVVAKKPMGFGTERSGILLQNEKTSSLCSINITHLFKQLQKTQDSR
jgi:hypothetical protein